MAPASDDEIDYAAATGTIKVKAAAALLLLTGIIVAFTAVQLFTMRYREELLELVPWAHLGLAVSLVLCSAMTYRARTWATVGGAAAAGLAFLLAGAWQGYAMANGVFSLLGLASVPSALAATLLCVVAIGDARRATRVRKQLADEGMKLGL